ncbi:hypothetical protein BDZ85DRAFT_261022 [Elsinoe ampelina]|uniref:Uncharacterized protein n=1 Tax=Elsinoe ampelina TaxID=302913 RepID=A0A6A6GFM3_9PEZI|nr:hypothetical protein BDZ85DRAFT_261022 [Elsinoe ampelina]
MDFPLGLYTFHPLRFSLAHKHHGFQMRSGWLRDPDSFEDREDHLNDMLIEPWAVNGMKYNMDEAFYPQLKRIIRSYKLARDMYDPGRASGIKDPCRGRHHVTWYYQNTRL